MDVGTAIVADCQAAHSVQPGERPFDYPAVAPELGRQLDATPSDSRLDPTNSTHRSTDAVIVGLVGVQLLRPSPGASSGLANGLDRVERSAQMKRVVVVGGRQQGSAAAPTARRLAESRLARDQSICPFCPSSCCRFRKIWPPSFRKIWPPEEGNQAWRDEEVRTRRRWHRRGERFALGASRVSGDTRFKCCAGPV